jgi:hypothetical protein
MFKNKLLLVVLLALGSLVVYYFITPKQERLSNEELSNLNEQTEDAQIVTLDLDTNVEEYKLYYYAQDDSACSGDLLPVDPTNPDNRFQYEEIDAIVNTLMDPVPQGYKTALKPGTILNQLRISKGVAYLDLNPILTIGYEPPCGFESRKRQLDAILTQFEAIDSVTYLVDGVEVALQ